MKHHGMLCSILLFSLFVSACKEQTLVSSGGEATLRDPSVHPQVIFTNPPNGGVGPYSTLMNGSNFTIMVQFNKLMDMNTFGGDQVRIEGFAQEPDVYVEYPYNRYEEIAKIRVWVSSAGDNRLVIGRTYTVTIDSSVLDIHGYPLSKGYTFSFLPEPYFRVVNAGPIGLTSDGSSTPWLQFNGKVNSSILSSLSITPVISGAWHIGSDSVTVYFSPSSDFPTATNFLVTAGAGASDRDGHALPNAYSFSFNKSNTLKLLYSYMTTWSNSPVYEFNFSTAMDTATVKSALSVSPSLPGTLYFPNGTWYGLYFFDPSVMPGTSGTISIGAGALSSKGIPITAYTTDVTLPGFSLERIYPTNYDNVSRFSSVELRANYDIDTATVRTRVSISPAVSGEWRWDRRHIHFIPAAQLPANTSFQVNVDAGLKTVSGYTVSQNFSAYFKTGN